MFKLFHIQGYTLIPISQLLGSYNPHIFTQPDLVKCPHFPRWVPPQSGLLSLDVDEYAVLSDQAVMDGMVGMVGASESVGY